jgi:hypothetical protein
MPYLQKVQNSESTLSNGTVVAKFRTKKADGTPAIVTRIVKSSKAIAAHARAAKMLPKEPKPLTVEQTKTVLQHFNSSVPANKQVGGYWW